MLEKNAAWSAAIVIGIAAVALLLVYENATGDVSSELSGIFASGSTAVDSASTSASSGGLSSTILGALQTFENVASFHNNPGAICGSFDAAGNCLGPKTYATLDDGVAAAEANISRYLAQSPSMTVQQFVQKWSGANGNVLSNYVNHVANELGLDPDDPIADAAGGDADNEGDSELDDLGGDGSVDA